MMTTLTAPFGALWNRLTTLMTARWPAARFGGTHRRGLACWLTGASAIVAVQLMAAQSVVAAPYVFHNVADTMTAEPSGTFDAFGLPSIDGGTTAFLGWYGGFSGYGIFTGGGAALTPIAKPGDPAPSGTFISVNQVTSISGGTASFWGNYSGGSGIFTGDGTTLTTIVKAGDAVPRSGTWGRST